MTSAKIALNRHLVDRLADAKAEMDRSERAYYDLRAEVLAADDLVGEEHEAVVKATKRSALDRAALEAHFGEKALAKFIKTTEGFSVTLRRRTR